MIREPHICPDMRLIKGNEHGCDGLQISNCMII